MALVGHISGSNRSSSVIGVSGSVIIANRPDALFPSSLPGPDVSFFVSGSIGGKGGAEKTVAVFGGDTVVSGSLTIGTGSIKVTSNDIQFGTTARIELNGSDIKFFDGSNPAGKTVSNLASSTPAGSDTQVQFNDGGNLGADPDFVFNKTFKTLSVNGIAVTGSAGLSVSRTLTVTQSITGSSTLTVNGSSLLNGGVQTTTLAASGNATILGTLGVTQSITGSSTLTVAGAAILNGGVQTTTVSTSGNTTVGGNLTVTGDLTVNGTTTTADVTTVTVEDPIIGLGFTSGSVAVTAGDRGWVGGLSGDGAGNVAMIWDNDFSEFAVGRTTATAASPTVTLTAYSPLHAGNIQGNIISASLGFSGSLTRLTDGTSYLIAGNNVSISSASNGAITISSTSSSTPGGLTTQVQFNDGGVFNGDAGLTYNKSTLTLSADTLSVTGSNGLAVTNNATILKTLNVSQSITGSSTLTVNGSSLLNGGVQTTTLATSGNATILGTLGVTQSITGSNTLTLAGAALLNGGVQTTTLAASSNATILGTLGVTLSMTGSSTLTLAGAALLNGGTQTTTLGVSSTATFNGDVDLGNATTDTVTFTGRIDSNVLPSTDSAYSLGSVDNRWQHIYTGDLHLRNERGDYTLIEEPEFLSIRFNKTGKRYKFIVEPVPELDEKLGEFSTGPKPKKLAKKKAVVAKVKVSKSNKKKQK